MDWYIFRQRLLAEHSLNLQAQQFLDGAMKEIERGLQILSQHGHHYHLAEGEEPQQVAFPRTVFHINWPGGRKVWCQAEIDELGEDWFDSLAEAHHSHGMRTQFAGRGGVGTRALPMVVLAKGE